MTVSVGFIGVGNMGNPMAGNVLKAGFPMTVFDKHPPAMGHLVQSGAQRGASAAETHSRRKRSGSMPKSSSIRLMASARARARRFPSR